ncbi:hypothetical protein [Streptococcus sp. zg-JUN1979]|uniref:hypothetical protein n=1 Tax=Streptococcus sp. zg-JUN1979 TaxID=3391450 RepID=UPI0039A4D50A
MAIKLGATEAISNFDIKKTLGELLFLEVRPVYEFEDYVNEETGEKRTRPTDVISEYDIYCLSSVVNGGIYITVPATAKGVEIDEEKAYREPIVFEGLSARLWERRERRTVGGQERTVSTVGTKIRANDFKLANGTTAPAQPKQDNQDKKG